jgi:hypothetical protein
MRFRFGITTLMGFIVFAAVGLAALRSASALWVSATFTATVTLLSASILGAMAARGRSRMAWAGLAVFGWVYLAVAFGPWPRNVDGPPPLLTVPLLDAIQDYVFSDGKTPYLTHDFRTHNDQVTGFRGNWLPAKGNLGPAPPAGGFKRVDLVAYRQAGHSLAAILFGLLGALVGRSFVARNEDDQSLSR